VDWMDVPAGVLVYGTAPADVDAIAAAHGDIGVQRSWILKEVPSASLDVAAFRISSTATTWKQWRAFVAAIGDAPTSVPIGPDDHPVDGVPWSTAQRFCVWSSEQWGFEVRLPTEHEWERAARGDGQLPYPWGGEYEPGRANLNDLGLGATVPVTAFPQGASPFGVLNMIGNVDEWTSSTYAPYPGAPSDVPLTEPWASDPHVTRGGGYLHGRDLARTARRHAVYPPGTGAGFRLVSAAR
jgi:toxoflavin biosynthesis protein ToxD